MKEMSLRDRWNTGLTRHGWVWTMGMKTTGVREGKGNRVRWRDFLKHFALCVIGQINALAKTERHREMGEQGG